MTNNQKWWIWRIAAAVAAGIGLVLLLNSVEMGLEQAVKKMTVRWEKGDILSQVDMAVYEAGHVLVYTAIGGILLGVGLNRALKPAGREAARPERETDQEPTVRRQD
ncbi:hypothetical protein [Saccharibacillus alkalitolerans]|uniref:Uncharacterized protein n=1 Tax=Saccharibacillus alkalitolerans TaxID=2705290 RepID=A0ABX0F948_9BACL|nr:hypothetical protein [Saccharibacillus alkalitolerans]NGZ76955.1 hypothetical protein [Saccharibacillus alkalitolerans]